MLGELLEDRYLVEEELGAGAMGHVYRARHIRCGRQVAIKVMRKDLARVPTIVERFAREALLAARLSHRNLVGVLDVGTTRDRQPMIVLELAPGRPLSELIDGPMAADRARTLACEILRGLAHAHSAGLVHRDLKPDNILVETTADGEEIPRIVDFGIATLARRDESIAGRRLTDLGTVIGTPSYMSPEQATAGEVDPRTDLFAIGVILYELLAGVTPFEGTNVEVALANCAKEPPPIRERAGIEVDAELEAIVRKLMARRVSERYQSAEEALAALAPKRPVVEIAAATVPMFPAVAQRLEVEQVEIDEPRPRRRWPVAAALAAAAATVVVACMARVGVADAAASVEIAASVEREAITAVEVAHEPAPRAAAARPLAAADAARPRAAAATARPLAAAGAARPRAAAATAAAPAAAPAVAVAPAVATAPAGEPETASLTSAAATDPIALRYMALGRTLAARAPGDALWARYLRVRIDTAYDSDATRSAVVAELAAIESAATRDRCR